MSEYTATIVWQSSVDAQTYIDRKYSRLHEWKFDGGTVVPASPSPAVVPAPFSNTANVDPEEAFVASISSCHMLFFLEFAAKKRFALQSYTDKAVGILEKNSEGKIAMTKVSLRPQAVFVGDKQPSPEQIAEIHHMAHEHCYIANSVKTTVVVEPVL